MSPGSEETFFQKYGLKALGVFLILMVIYTLFGNNGGIFSVFEMRNERDKLVKEIEQLREEKAELKRQIQLLKEKDPVAIETEARRQGMIRKGEKVYKLDYQEIQDSVRKKQ